MNKYKEVNIFIFLLIYICLFAFNVKATDLPVSNLIPFNHLSIEKGLSQVTVNEITQDKDGFLWFATEDGLNRYDGNKFIVYQQGSDKPISGNIINFVFNDSKNRIWAGTNGQGINLKKEKTFIRIPIIVDGLVIEDIKATVLFEDAALNLWLGTWGHGLFKYSEVSKQFKHINSDNHYDRIWAIEEIGSALYLGTDKQGIALLNEGQLKPFAAAEQLTKETIKALLNVNDKLYIGTQGQGLWVHLKDSIRAQQLTDHSEILNTVVHKIFHDQTGNLWVGTLGDGLFKITEDNIWTHQSVGNEKESLSNNRILSLYQDNSGIFWVGTEGAGLNYYDPFSLLIRNIRSGNNNHENLNDKMIYAISSDEKNNWWFGTESGGVNHWNSKNKQFNYYNVESEHLQHNTVRALLSTKWGTFVGTLDGFSLITDTGEVVNKWNTTNLNNLTTNIILSFEQSGNNNIWIGTYDGLFLFDVEENIIKQSFLDKENSGPFTNSIIFTLLQTDTELWVGTLNDGIYHYDLKSHNWKSFHHEQTDPNSLGSDSISSLYVDKKKQLWVGTNGAGLQRFDDITGAFTQIDKSRGLGNNVVYGILEDADNNIWVSTNAGLSRYNYRLNTIKNYTTKDGIQGREFNAGAYYQADNIMAFGGINGVSWFDENTDKLNQHLPQTQITDIRILNKNISEFTDPEIRLEEQLDGPKLFSLNYDKTMFSIEFAALHFSSPEQNSYQYRMLGLDNSWINSQGVQSEATFTGLPAGSYQFQVKGISKDGFVDATPALLDIIILPPLWKTWWAYSFYLIISMLIIWRYLTFLRRKIEIEQNISAGLKKIDQLKERLVETEKMAVLGELSSNVAHSLRNPLASIRTSAELLEDDAGLPAQAADDAKNIISEVDRLSSWIKELLEYSKDQSNNMKLMNMVESCKHIIDDYRSKFIKNKINCEFSSNITEANIKMDPILFQHLLNSLIDNAIEAISDEGVIQLHIEKNNDNEVQLSLTDSGVGIAFSKQTQIFDSAYSSKANGLGMGLSLVKRIVERHNADIAVKSELNKGTEFIITFNLLQE